MSCGVVRFSISMVSSSSIFPVCWLYYFFFCIDPATTEIYTLSLHDALLISSDVVDTANALLLRDACDILLKKIDVLRSEEHTSELQSRQYLVCRLLLEKKKYSGEERRAQSHGRPRAPVRPAALPRQTPSQHP